MKKTIKFAVVVAIACMTQIVNAQKLSFPAAWEQYRSQMTFSRSQDLGNGNWRDVYLYQGKEIFNDGYCPTCTAATTTPQNINVDNTQTVYAYNDKIEQQKADAAYISAMADAKTAEAYEKWARAQIKQGRWGIAKDFLIGGTAAAGTFMDGLAGILGMKGVNINQTFQQFLQETGRGFDDVGINLGQNPNQSPVIDYTLGQNQNQNQQGGGNGGDQGGISPCGPDYIWLNGQCIHK
jgi:hypothetical protein